MMSRTINQLYEFGPFRLDPAEHQLLREGVAVPLRPKVFDILLLLVKNSGHLVEKDELLGKVWPGQFVEEGNLNKNISMLRQALGESANSHQYIETVPKLGYRFVASVSRVPNGFSELTVETHSKTRIAVEEVEVTDGHSIVDDGLEKTSPGATIVTRSHAAPKENINYRIADILKRHDRAAALALTALVVLVAAVIFLTARFTMRQTDGSSGKSAAAPLPEMMLTRLTYSGKAGATAISPDGRYVVYVMNDGGRQSLWLRQIGTDSNTEIAAAAEVAYESVTFSHDGSHIYFVKSDRPSPIRVLYRMPVLGGIPTKLIEDVLDSISLSPDDAQIAFARVYRNRGECALIVANADGGGERELATRKSPDVLSRPAWSPDGKVIAGRTGNGDRSGFMCNVVEVRVADGAQRNITREAWPWIRDVAWLRDGSGLLMTAMDQSGRYRIWLLSYPGGEARRVTNDFDKYFDLSLTADSNTVATTLTRTAWNVWIAPNNDPNLSLVFGARFPVDVSRARQIASGVGGLTWTPDGRVLFTSYVSGSGEIWSAKPDGTDLKQLTTGPGTKSVPVVSPDGRHIVYASDVTGAAHLWRMEIDGRNARPLTEGHGGENYPCYSPDGKWVIYTQVSDWTLWRVPADGGAPEQVTSAYSKAPSVSPDGRLIAYYFRDKQQDQNWRIAVVPFAGGTPVQFFDVPRGDFQSWYVRWTRDGRGLTYEAANNGFSNIWLQPLNGGRPTRLTDFKSDRIAYFDWSPDGSQLACIRGDWAQDIVLIKNFR